MQASERRTGRGPRIHHKTGRLHLAVKLVLLNLTGLGAGTTGLREIRGNCVDNVLVGHLQAPVGGMECRLPTSVPMSTF